MASGGTTPSQDVLEKHYLAFEFNINQVQFNHLGRYYLKLSVCSTFSTKDYSSIRVQVNKSKDIVQSNEAQTDSVTQAELKTYVRFKDYKFTFFLPKGFCKNDKNHDVHLQLEAYSSHEGDGDMPDKKVGEARFAIYPRSNHPKVNVYADMEENMFHKDDVLSLFRTASAENVKMHCGRVKYDASFRKVRKMPDASEKPTPAITPAPHTSIPPTPSVDGTTSPPVDMMGDGLVIPAAPDEDPDYGQRVQESPLPPDDQRTVRPGYGAAHIARPGKDEVVVVFHAAANLPSLEDGKAPKAYCTLYKRPEDIDKVPTQIVEQQQEQLKNYNEAVHKMGQDILSLRLQIRDLDSINDTLRRELAVYNDATTMLLDSQELDGLTKPELAARYVAMKQSVTSQAEELFDYKERIHKLQNELIRKNDQEKEFLMLSEAHVTQNELLLTLQEQVAKQQRLDDTVKKQEEMIANLKHQLDDQHGTPTASLSDENALLKEEIEALKDGKAPPSPRELAKKYDRAEARIRSLEKEIKEMKAKDSTPYTGF